ncbi:MAG: LamG domain-containing protein [Planctomycetota bacterium]|nr:LamG domain-containing protein [Planctomycetota bacterium]
MTFSGGAANLDGVGGQSYIDLGGNDIASIAAVNNAVTIEAWCTLESNGYWARLFVFGSGTANSIFQNTADPFGDQASRLVIANGGEQVLFNFNNPLAKNPPRQVHTVAIFDAAAGTMTLSIDGISATQAYDSVFRPLTEVGADFGYIGKSMYDDPYLKGSITEFRLWNKALTATDIARYDAFGPDTLPEYSLTSSATGPWTAAATWAGTAPPSGYPDTSTEVTSTN